MPSARLLGTTDAIKTLSKRLAISKKVSRLDSNDEPQAWTLAYNLSELEESFKDFTDNKLQRLVSEDLDEAEINDLLHDIGEEFRHILYHITAPEYYSHLRSIGNGGKA